MQINTYECYCSRYIRDKLKDNTNIIDCTANKYIFEKT